MFFFHFQLDLPFSQTFYRWVVGEESCLNLTDVRHVAPELWRSLCRLQQVALHAESIKRDNSLSQVTHNIAYLYSHPRGGNY